MVTNAIPALYRQYRRTPFQMGAHDCVLWCARCLDAQYGTTYEMNIKKVFGSPTNLQAFRIVRKAGGLRPLIEGWLGPMQPWTAVEQGGVILLKLKKVIHVAGIATPNGVLTVGRSGLVLLPYDLAVGGWSCRK